MDIDLHELREIKESLVREIREIIASEIETAFGQSRLKEIEDMLMALAPEVQALLDAVAAQGSAITAATGEMTTLEASVADLQAKLAAAPAGAPMAASDLAAIVTATDTISASVASLKAAMPVAVPAPVVAAVDPNAPPAAAVPPAVDVIPPPSV